MNLTGRQPHFRKQKPHSNLYRVMILAVLIVSGLVVYRGYLDGTVKPLFAPTPTPTRTFNSYEMEGDTYFEIGKLDCTNDAPDACAIGAYQHALEIDPENADIYTRLARIQTYSTALLSTNQEKYNRLQDALVNAEKAVELDPEDSSARAVHAFVLDWIASIPAPLVTEDQRVEWLYQAEKEATLSYTLDETNSLALAYYAEILVDQGKLLQAEQKIQQALEGGQDQMDVHRVYAYVLEYMGSYTASLEEYLKASAINPNLTFLYIDIGNKYRHLANISTYGSSQQNTYYEEALTYFAKAVEINTRLGIKDPTPYVAIANTYAQKGDFFAAVLNVRKALELNPTSAEVYAQLGLVYHKSRNYEGSIPAFKCALEGCTAEEACTVRECDPATDQAAGIYLPIEGLPLDDATWVYYTTYGSVLAGLHKPSRPYCEDAVRVLSMVRDMYASNAEIMAIVQPSEEICQAAGYSVEGVQVGATPTEPTPTGTGQAGATPIETTEVAPTQTEPVPTEPTQEQTAP